MRVCLPPKEYVYGLPSISFMIIIEGLGENSCETIKSFNSNSFMEFICFNTFPKISFQVASRHVNCPKGKVSFNENFHFRTKIFHSGWTFHSRRTILYSGWTFYFRRKLLYYGWTFHSRRNIVYSAGLKCVFAELQISKYC